MIEVKIKLKKPSPTGETEEIINPAVNIIVDNTYHHYEYDPSNIESIEFYEVED